MEIQKEVQLKNILWYKIGGTAKYFLTCKNKEDIVEALDFVKKNNSTKMFVCGQGSNLIFSDNYFDGVVIHITNNEKVNGVHVDENGYVKAFAGALLDEVILFSFENNLVGLEWAGGLPGTLGAAVRGNVGAYGGEIKDSLFSADVLDFAGETPVLKTLSNRELAFAYRESLVKKQKKMIVVSAKFALKKATAEELVQAKEVYQKNTQTRRDRHPLEYPNCGSVFKNIRNRDHIDKILSVYPDLAESIEKKWYGKVAVASLIERLGLKGYRIGDAQVSEKHALFIVNVGHAKSQDVLQIIDTIQKKFQEAFGFGLEVEVEVVQ